MTELRRAILESDVLVYAFGIDNPPGARQRTERLDADELRQQYSLGYSTWVARDGAWHELRVDVRGRGMKVRARRGFIAS